MNTTEIMRLISNMVRIGTVSEIDFDSKRARLVTGDNNTNWLPWPEQNAGQTASWNPPQENELWVIFSPGGDLSQAVMGFRLQTDEFPPPFSVPGKKGIKYPDGTVISYDHEQHLLNIDVPEDGKIEMNVTGHVTLNCPKIDIGEPDDLQPSTLGDNLAAALEDLIAQINAAQVIGNLGAPTSPIQGVKPVEVADLLEGGNSYSKKNRNQ